MIYHIDNYLYSFSYFTGCVSCCPIGVYYTSAVCNEAAPGTSPLQKQYNSTVNHYVWYPGRRYRIYYGNCQFFGREPVQSWTRYGLLFSEWGTNTYLKYLRCNTSIVNDLHMLNQIIRSHVERKSSRIIPEMSASKRRVLLNHQYYLSPISAHMRY